MTAGRRFVHLAATRGALLLFSAVMGIVIARALGPAGRGVYALALTVAQTTAILGGMAPAHAQTALWRRPEHRPGLAGNALWLGLALGVVAGMSAGFLIIGLGLTIAPAGILASALVTVPLLTALAHVNGVLVLQARTGTMNRAALVANAAQCAGLLLFAALGILTPAWAVCLWTGSIATHLVVRRLLLGGATPGRDLGLARRALTTGARYLPGFAAFNLLLRVDVLILGALTAPSAVGVYSLAVTLAELAYVGCVALSQVLLPGQVEREEADAAAFTARAVRLCLLLGLTIDGLVCLTAPVLVPLVYGTEFRASLPCLFALLPGSVVLGAALTIEAHLLRLGRPMRLAAIQLSALALNVLLNLALIPMAGPVGSAAAATVSYVGLATLAAGWFVRATGVPPAALVPGRAEVRQVRRLLARLSHRGARPARSRTAS